MEKSGSPQDVTIDLLSTDSNVSETQKTKLDIAASPEDHVNRVERLGLPTWFAE